MTELHNASVLGRLLEEISWEGSRVKGYRDGGRGRENVLTAEVLLPLTFLPQEAFLAEVVRSAHGAEQAREAVAGEAELLVRHDRPARHRGLSRRRVAHLSAYCGSSRVGRPAILAALESLGLVCPTLALPHRLDGMTSIDHIAIPVSVGYEKPRHIAVPARLSDHDAYVLDAPTL
jgi:hypothetical protein